MKPSKRCPVVLKLTRREARLLNMVLIEEDWFDKGSLGLFDRRTVRKLQDRLSTKLKSVKSG